MTSSASRCRFSSGVSVQIADTPVPALEEEAARPVANFLARRADAMGCAERSLAVGGRSIHSSRRSLSGEGGGEGVVEGRALVVVVGRAGPRSEDEEDEVGDGGSEMGRDGPRMRWRFGLRGLVWRVRLARRWGEGWSRGGRHR